MQMRKKYATFDDFCSDKMKQTTKEIVKNKSERLSGDNLLKQIFVKINAGNTRGRRVANTGC
jgi:succinyl-CoA synthetase beta subunit